MAWNRKITRERLEAFLKGYATQERVLDVGAGGSGYGRFFPNRVTVDIDPRRNPDIVADAHHLPFKDGEFGYVLCTEALEHLHSPHVAIAEMHRILQKNGLLILTTRFLFPIHDAPNDYFRFTKYGLRYLFKDWDILELREEVSSKDTFAVLLQRLGFQSKMRGGKALKFVIYLLAKFIRISPDPIVQEYGDIKKTKVETGTFTSGYYIICRKNEN